MSAEASGRGTPVGEPRSPRLFVQTLRTGRPPTALSIQLGLQLNHPALCRQHDVGRGVRKGNAGCGLDRLVVLEPVTALVEPTLIGGKCRRHFGLRMTQSTAAAAGGGAQIGTTCTAGAPPPIARGRRDPGETHPSAVLDGGRHDVGVDHGCRVHPSGCEERTHQSSDWSIGIAQGQAALARQQ